jgi:hypothetical protein
VFTIQLHLHRTTQQRQAHVQLMALHAVNRLDQAHHQLPCILNG